MISIPRTLARQLRTVFRKASPKSSGRLARAAFTTGPDGLRVRLLGSDIAVEHHRPGALPVDAINLSVDALQDFGGANDTLVRLTVTGADSIEARWTDGGASHVKVYEPVKRDRPTSFPELPKRWAPATGVLEALAAASATTARDSVRYGLTHIQLRGKSGQMVATDGRQLLIQEGFHWPWPGEAMVPASSVYGCRELSEGQVAIGRTPQRVCLRCGPWTLALPIIEGCRFPQVENAIPREQPTAARMHLDPQDATFLESALLGLPGSDQANAPVTINLTNPPTIWGRPGNKGKATELVLARSKVAGSPVRLCLNRNLLLHAVRLGFREYVVNNSSTALLCPEPKRTFVVMPLAEDKGAPPIDPTRIRSDQTAAPRRPTPAERRPPIVPMPAPSPRPATASPSVPDDGLHTEALLREAEALKAQLREAHDRAARLLAAVRQHHRQSRIVRSTVAALRQLQRVTG